MIDEELLKTLSLKAKIAITALITGALAQGRLRVEQKDPDVFHLQAQVAAGTYVTINVLDFNAVPAEGSKQVVPVEKPTEEVVEEVIENTNVVPFKPAAR